MHRQVLELRRAGCAVEQIFLDLLAPAARELGLLWEDDQCDFTDVTVGASELDPVQVVQTEWFDILGLSAGHHARADWLRECFTALRQASRNRAIGVVVGGPLFLLAPECGPAVRRDVTVTDGQQAPA